jgi:transcriptional regulator PpsR
MVAPVQVFKSPKDSIGDLGAPAAARLIAASSDVAVVVDGTGVIRDVSFNKDDLSLELDGNGRWLGANFLDTVTADSRAKVKGLLQDAAAQKPSGWRHVNHLSPAGEDIPVQYSAIDIGHKDRYVVIGRDLRPMAAMQQRLITAQQAMERDYMRLRQAETRYRLLFQVASEAVMIVDPTGSSINDANPAALALFDTSAPQFLKTNLAAHFEPADAPVVTQLLADVRGTGRDASAPVRLARNKSECILAASMFRQESGALFLVRLWSPSGMIPAPTAHGLKATAALLRYFERAVDALAIAHHDGRIVRVNAAFVELAQLANEDQARGEPLDRWLGRAGVDFNVAFATLRQHGHVKLFATLMRGELGGQTEVEVSAVLLDDGDGRPGFGFAIRNVDRRLNAAAQPAAAARELPRSVAQLTEMIGRVPLRDLVRETTDVIEKLSIEAALELTGDNRASAAEMLGLSRQSLYVKLRRFGLAEHATGDDSDDG